MFWNFKKLVEKVCPPGHKIGTDHKAYKYPSKTKLAEALGISYKVLYDYINRDTAPNSLDGDWFTNACEVFDCTRDDLIPTVYKIKPLVWKKSYSKRLSNSEQETYQHNLEWTASTPVGDLIVGLYVDDRDVERSCEWLYRKEYDDTGVFDDCKSCKQGKRLAEEYWKEQLSKCLETVNLE